MGLFIRKPQLSIVIVFYNMIREAKRTLFSLTIDYQENINIQDYEVIVIDSGSTEPLDKKWVETIQSNFRYFFVDSKHPSPSKAMNFGIGKSRSNTVVCCIDGARILTPNILSLMIKSQKLFDYPFVYTLGFHVGDKQQNYAIEDGYCQEVEDELLKSLKWESNGYKLFNRSCLGGSSPKGYFGRISESNCFSANKKILKNIGGFDERFISPGGGLVNLDVFSRLHLMDILQPVMLLGEGTFHQFHGGVATNVPREVHPFKVFDKEYQSIRGECFKHLDDWLDKRFYLGTFNQYSQRFK